MSYKDLIKGYLADKFIESEDVGNILGLALANNKNCILYGPAGHGKSEMVMEAVRKLDIEEDCFVQSFGEGMDETRLFGGLDFGKLEEQKVLEYNANRSFLNYRVAVFEELFDAPPIVLLSLKDTLTARELRNGAQRFKMRTGSIIALTNRSPSEISEIGPAAHALIERFPLQLEVKWNAYDYNMYRKLFSKVKPRANGFLKTALAKACSQVCEDGGFVSPRSAIHAMEICQSDMNGYQDERCFENLRYVPEFSGSIESIMADYRATAALNQAEGIISSMDTLYTDLASQLQTTRTSNRCLVIAKQAEGLADSVQKTNVPDALTNRRESLLSKINNLITESSRKAMDLVTL